MSIHHQRCRGTFPVLLTVTLAFLMGVQPVFSAAQTPSASRIIVVRGDNQKFDMAHVRPIELIVEVRDSNGPRRNVVLFFIILPAGGGAAAYFAGGAQRVMATTDASGRASVLVDHPNSTSGDFEIRVEGDGMTPANIKISNVKPPTGFTKFVKSKWMIIGVGVAGAAVAAVAATPAGGGPPSTPGTSGNTPTGVSLGQPQIGVPR